MNSRLLAIEEKIKDGKPVIDIIVQLADSSITEIAAYAGCDFVWIDTEHSLLDRQEVYHHVLAAQAAGICAFVRVPGVECYQVKHILDMGADGIIFPFVDTPELAKQVVDACTYPTDGGRRGF